MVSWHKLNLLTRTVIHLKAPQQWQHGLGAEIVCLFFCFHCQDLKCWNASFTNKHTHTPARRQYWSPGRWALPSILADSCCCRCWPAEMGGGGVSPVCGRSPAFGGRTLETPQRELGSEERHDISLHFPSKLFKRDYHCYTYFSHSMWS